MGGRGEVLGRVRRRAGRRFDRPGANDPRHQGGSGTPLLLLHGVGVTWRSWSPVLAELERHHAVLAPTLLGHHGADPLAEGVVPSVRALVDGVEAEMDRLGLARAHLVGNSLGGWVALELARRGRARSVVVFSPAGAWRSMRRARLLTAGMRTAFRVGGLLAPWADTIASRRLGRRLLMSAVVAHPERIAPADLAAELRGMREAPAVAPLLRAIVREPLAPLPPTPDVPIRVAWGEQDRIIPVRGHAGPILARVPEAEFVLLPDAGHVPMADDPAAVVRRILEITRAVDAAAA